MTWVSKKERLPPQDGWYNVIKLNHGVERVGFFRPIPAHKSLDYMQWRTSMELENNYVDRCIYRKYKAFFNKNGIEQEKDEIIYWYELDPIPEDKNN